jgi:signal transduction histidine kinase
MQFTDLNNFICGSETPTVLKIFDFSTAPHLLFYSYIPIAVISLLIGLFIYKKDNRSLTAKLLFSMTAFFVLWVLNILVQWVASYHIILMFGWQLTALFEVGLFLTAFYLAYVFVNKKDLPILVKGILIAIGVTVAILVPTALNIPLYDMVNCEGVVGPLWSAIYVFEPIVIALIALIGIHAFKKAQSREIKKEIRLFSIGIVVLLTTFFLSNFYGELTRVYEFNLWGPVGMLVFFVLLGYLIVRFHTFNIKLFATQALVLFIATLIASKFFYDPSTLDIIINTATLTLFGISGFFLIKSVRVEIQQKDRLQDLSLQLSHSNEKLKELDKLKTEFLSLASHQLRSPLTAIKGYASMLIEGSFGKLAVKTAEPVKRIYTSAQGLANIVEDLLNVSKIEQGGMKYEFMPTDLSVVATNLYNEMQIPAQSKNITLTLDMQKYDEFMATADPTKIKQVFLNLVDNSIKYTPDGGTIKTSLSREGNTIVFAVTDSGMGISAETKQKLFEKFSRGEGGKINTGGSGLGLYLAKQIAIAHKGDIDIESDGLGKGSTFKVHIPASGAKVTKTSLPV